MKDSFIEKLNSVLSTAPVADRCDDVSFSDYIATSLTFQFLL